MREPATLKLDRGDEFRVEVDSDDLEDEEIVVRRSTDGSPPKLADRLAVIDRHLARAKRHPAGTTDRLLKADRQRPY
jgi:hypothetical protein